MPAMKAPTPPTRRGFHFAEFKALDEQHGTFEGYLAVFNNEDEGGDIIEPGAFSKTLVELKSRMAGRNGRYLLPIFWGHDPNEPIGGFTDAKEDSHGLYVRGELDLDIPQGQRAYSGMVKGYCDSMSIGYFTMKYDYDRQARRHLKELALFEGSVLSTPMNPLAVVTEVKSATGKATWPLGERDAAWDNGAAHKRIVAWATDDSGNVDTGKLKSVHFYSPEGDDLQDVSKFKLLFCDVSNGDVKAMPKGIFACAGSHGVDAATDISADDKAAIKNKISAYYKRMASEFDDDSIVAPWDKESSGGKAKRAMPTDLKPRHKAAMDFTTAFQQMSADDTLQDEWGDSFQALVNALDSVMWRGVYMADSGMMGGDGEPFDAQDAADTILTQFSSAISDLVKRSLAAAFVPCLDDDGDSFLDPDGPNADGDTAYDGDFMGLDTRRAGRKAGRMMSAANHQEMGGMLTAMKKAMNDAMAQHKALTAFHAKMGGDTEPGAGDNTNDTTQNDGKTDGKSLNTQGAGLPERNTTPLTADDVSKLIRDRMRAQALAQRVGNQ